MIQPNRDALDRATEAYVRELVQRPDQVVGDFVGAIVRAYLNALPDDGPLQSDLDEAEERRRHYDQLKRDREP